MFSIIQWDSKIEISKNETRWGVHDTSIQHMPPFREGLWLPDHFCSERFVSKSDDIILVINLYIKCLLGEAWSAYASWHQSSNKFYILCATQKFKSLHCVFHSEHNCFLREIGLGEKCRINHFLVDYYPHLMFIFSTYHVIWQIAFVFYLFWFQYMFVKYTSIHLHRTTEAIMPTKRLIIWWYCVWYLTWMYGLICYY